MSSTSDALVIEGQVADKLIDLLSQTLDKQNVTEQERDSFKQQAADLLAKSKTEDQTNAAAVIALTAKYQAMLDKVAGATPAPVAPANPVTSPVGDASATATPASGTPVTPATGDTSTPNPVASGTPVTPSTGDASTPNPVASGTPVNSSDGTPNTPVVNTNPVGDTSASTTAK